MNTAITSFFDGSGKDTSGRTLAFILKQDDEFLERDHTWIQCVFPLPTPSKFNPSAPLADAETYAALANASSIKALAGIDDAFDRFILFLGLKPYVESLGYDMPSEAPAWWRKGNHNALRVSRAIKHLEYLNTDHHSALAMVLRLALRRLAIRFPEGVSDASLAHWGVLIFGREPKEIG